MIVQRDLSWKRVQTKFQSLIHERIENLHTEATPTA